MDREDIKALIAKVKEEQKAFDDMPETERRLRRMLCLVIHGHRAYTDDGEASDSSAWPAIDYMRDTPDEIEEKLRKRQAGNRAKHREPQTAF